MRAARRFEGDRLCPRPSCRIFRGAQSTLHRLPLRRSERDWARTPHASREEAPSAVRFVARISVSRSKLVSRETLVLVHDSGEVKPVCRRVMRVSPSRCFPEGMSLPSAFPEGRRDATCCTSFRGQSILGNSPSRAKGCPLTSTRKQRRARRRDVCQADQPHGGRFCSYRDPRAICGTSTFMMRAQAYKEPSRTLTDQLGDHY